jgi:uncharacterized iron-regulated protein
MAKSAAVKLQEFMNECHGTRAVLKEFADVSKTKFGDYGYAAGYLESMIVDVIMELPKARRDAFRAQLHNKAYQMSMEQA